MTILVALLLISTGAFAQSGETPLKGDVNEDGKVDVADINAIIKIIKDAGGTAEAPTYYWYVGQTDPSTMSSISPIVPNTDMSSPGWREIGTTLPNYSSSNKLWSGGTDGTSINMGSFKTSYLALPNNSIKVYSVGTDLTNDNYIISNEPIQINGVNYYIYTSKSNFKYFKFDLY